MDINVLVIDDNPIFADSLKYFIEAYNSKFQNIQYVATVKSGNDAYDDAKEYIKGNIEKIDLIFCDYNLTGSLGTTLLDQAAESFRLIYKVLFSVTSRSKYLSEKKNFVHNKFCKSKDFIDVDECLRDFEKQILDIKLNGNLIERTKLEICSNRISQEKTRETFAGIPLLEILYFKIDKDYSKLLHAEYRDWNSKTIKQISRTTHSLAKILESPIPFFQIHQSTIINLLWVSELDIVNGYITFIAINNECVIRAFEFGNVDYQKQLLEKASEISHTIPSFFKTQKLSQ